MRKVGTRPLGGEWQTAGLTDIRREEVRAAHDMQKNIRATGEGLGPGRKQCSLHAAQARIGKELR